MPSPAWIHYARQRDRHAALTQAPPATGDASAGQKDFDAALQHPAMQAPHRLAGIGKSTTPPRCARECSSRQGWLAAMSFALDTLR